MLLLACLRAGASSPDSLSAFRLPPDSKAGEPYNKHFRPSEVLKGNPSLEHPDFAESQNLLGVARQGEFTLYFRRNKTDLDEDYLWNPQQIKFLRRFFKDYKILDSVTVYAFASPEGHYGHNVWLSLKRAETARKFILDNSDTDSRLVHISQQEENWPGLRQAVRQFYTRPNRDDVLWVLNEPGLPDAVRKNIIIAMDGGKTYEYLIDTLMPPLRNAVFSGTWVPKYILPRVYGVPEDAPLAHYGTNLKYTPKSELWAKRTIVALKTNALYDLATAINYQIEVPIGKKYSAVWEHYFPWWVMNDNRICVQYLTLGGEARWWFRPQPRPETEKRVLRDVLVGHYIGAYGTWGKVDLQWDMKGRYQCFPVVSAGLTYGYATPLTKHLNLELSASFGYARIPYQHYIPSEDWQILWRDRDNAGVTHYIGPTKATITLSMPILVKYRVR